MAQNFTQLSVTGTNLDGTATDLTTKVNWSVSDPTIVVIAAGSSDGAVTIQSAGKIWGGTVAVTATYPGFQTVTGNILVIASDSGSIAPLMPQEDDHWRALGLSPWASAFGCQEGTGSLVGSGSAGLMLTASVAVGNVFYGQSFPGWVRSGIVISGGLGQQFAIAGAPTAVNQSWAFLCYSNFAVTNTNDGGFIGILHATTAQRRYGLLAASTGPTYTSDEVHYLKPTGPVPYSWNDRIHPWLLVVNNTTGDVVFCSDISVTDSGSTPSVVTEAPKGFGSISGRATPSGTFVYMAIATGSTAEALSTVSASADFLSRLGWNVPWKDCPVDSGSIRLPFLPSHWSSLGLSPWTATWNLQETAGNVTSYSDWAGKDVNGWTLTANAVGQYNYALPNWKRGAINFAAVSAHRFINTLDYGPPAQFDPTGSMAFLVYAQLVGGSSTNITGIGSQAAGEGTWLYAAMSPSGNPILSCSGSSVTGSFSISDGQVHPVLIVQDVTNGRTKLYTDLEAVTGSYSRLAIVTSLTASMGIGGVTLNGGVAASGNYNYFAFTTGSLAESLSDDGTASHFLKTLGWSVPW